MNRRNFVQGFALIVASMAAPLAIAGAPAKSSEQATAPQAAQPFRKITVVVCTIVDMISGKQRIVSIENSAPIMISEGREPFALSIGERDDEYLSMTIHGLRDGQLTEGQTTYIGRSSTQILRKKGIVLMFVSHDT